MCPETNIAFLLYELHNASVTIGGWLAGGLEEVLDVRYGGGQCLDWTPFILYY